MEQTQQLNSLPQSNDSQAKSRIFRKLAVQIPPLQKSVSQEIDVSQGNKPSRSPNYAIKSSNREPSTSKHRKSQGVSSRSSIQPTAIDLATIGVKVRDFAYESTLPPVRPVYLHPRQIQPGIESLKRPRVEDRNVQDEIGRDPKKTKVTRTLTEPVLEEASNPLPTRARGFTDINDYDPEDEFLGYSSQQAGYASTSQSQLPPQYIESQDSEPYIDTPLVTPNGSLHWKVAQTSTVPTSQTDTESRVVVPEVLLSHSQLTFPQGGSTGSSQQGGTRTILSSPLSEIPSPSPMTSPSPMPVRKPPASSSSPSRINGLPQENFNLSTPPNTRYHLRKRKAHTTPSSPTKAPGAHTLHPPTTSRRGPMSSIRVSHAISKSRSAANPASSRVLRNHTAESPTKKQYTRT